MFTKFLTSVLQVISYCFFRQKQSDWLKVIVLELVFGPSDQDIYVELVFFNPFLISVHEFELDVEEQQRRVNEGLDKEDDLRYNLMSLTN